MKPPTATDSLVWLKDNPEWIFEHVFTVATEHGVQPLHPWQWQTDYWRGLSGRDITCKSRDIGSSVAAVAWFVHRVIFHGGSLVIVANKEENSKNLLRIARQFIGDLSRTFPQLGFRFGRNDATTIEFLHPKTGAPYKRIRALPAGPDVGRSERSRYVLATEMAFWERADQTWSSVTGTAVAGMEVIVESTPNGFGNLFARLWHDRENGFQRHLHDWEANPAHNDEWYADRWQNRASDALFAQEYLCDFIQSGRPWIDATTLPEPREPLPDCDIPRHLVGIPGLSVYRDMEGGFRIISFTDTAEGLAHGDWNVTTAWDADSGAQLYQLRDRLPPDVHAEHHHAVATIYQGVHYYEENNKSGGIYEAACKRLGTPGARPHRTTTTTRPDMEKEANRLLRLNEIEPADAVLLEECRVVCYDDKGKVAAPSGYHDDAWITLCGAAYYMARSGADITGFGTVGELDATRL